MPNYHVQIRIIGGFHLKHRHASEKNKILNHSIDRVKKLICCRRVIHKERVKATGLCDISYRDRVIRENVPRKITEFSMGRHVGAPSDGHQHGGRKPAKTSRVYLGNFKALLLSAELSHIDINASITC